MLTDPNLFEALFTWRPREGLTPAENFLTEALLYVVSTHPAALKNWLSVVLEADVDESTVRVSSRKHFSTEAGTPVYPDVEITGVLSDGQHFQAFIEHKWGSSYSREQMVQYSELLMENRK